MRHVKRAIGFVRYIYILTRLRGFQVKVANLLSFFCFSIPIGHLDTKKTAPNIGVRPENLGAMSEYWNIERGLLWALFVRSYVFPSNVSKEFNLCKVLWGVICHFLTNRQSSFFPLAKKKARQVMKLVVSRIFFSRFDLLLSTLPSCYCKKQCQFFIRLSSYWQWISLSPRGYFDNAAATLTMLWQHDSNGKTWVLLSLHGNPFEMVHHTQVNKETTVLWPS